MERWMLKFELTLPRAKTWKDVVSAISTIIERGAFPQKTFGTIVAPLPLDSFTHYATLVAPCNV